MFPVIAAVIAATLWAGVLRRAAHEQSPQAAWGLAILAIVATLLVHARTRHQLTRALAWAALLALLVTPPALLGAVAFLTGVTW